MADELVIQIYRETRRLPKSETFGLVSQMRRASFSVAANLVEGCARHGEKELFHFLNMAFGSIRELGYAIDLCHRLGYFPDDVFAHLSRLQSQAAASLTGLLRSFQAPSKIISRPRTQDPGPKTQDPRPRTLDKALSINVLPARSVSVVREMLHG
jgi:four helix bundle protein